MNPDDRPSPRETLEARLTALLLGELSPDEADAVRQALAQDPELARLHDRLKQTIALVREATAQVPAEQAAPAGPPLQLSAPRREALLQRFRQSPAPPAARPQRSKRSWLVPASIAALLLVLVLPAMILPSLSKAKARATRLQHFAVWEAEKAEPTDTGVRGLGLKLAAAKSEPAAPASTPPTPPPAAQPGPTRPRAGIYLPTQAERSEAEARRGLADSGPAQPVEHAGQAVELAPLPIQFPKPTLKGTPAELPQGPHIEPLSDKPAQTRIVGLPEPAAARPESAPAQTVAPPTVPPPPARELELKRDFSYFATVEAGGRAETPAEKKEGAAILGDRLVLGQWFETPKDTKPDAAAAKPLAGAVTVQTLNGLAGGAGQTVEAAKKTAAVEPQADSLDFSARLDSSVSKLGRETLAADRAGGRLNVVLPQTGTEALSRAGAVTNVIVAGLPTDPQRLLSRRSDTLSPTAGEVRDEGAAELKLAERLDKAQAADEDRAAKRPAQAPIPQPEVVTAQNPFSTFSLNVSDVSFKLAAASLEKGQMPDVASIRSEEFINAFDYRDPEPPPGVPIAFAWERARYPFAHNRDLVRFSIKTAARGREAGRPLNLVLLLDNSGSMERADRVRIIQECLLVLAAQLKPQDRVSVVTFARTARLWIDGRPGPEAARELEKVGQLTPQGGTNLEDALALAYQTALRHYLAGGINRVVLLTDGAANLGNVDPESLKQKVETHRKQGVALDCFGIGWEGYNDDLLEVLSRNGDGRYGFINTPEEAATEFAGQLAGALQVAASDVKVQVEFNPQRVTSWRQIGYAKHQLTKEQFRDNTVDAAEIAAAEAGNALYVVEVNPRGEGPLAVVRVRYKVPGTADYREHEWLVPFTGPAVPLELARPAMRLAATAAAFSEWLAASPFAAEVTPDRLLALLRGVPEVFGADARPKKLEWMIRQAKSIAGR